MTVRRDFRSSYRPARPGTTIGIAPGPWAGDAACRDEDPDTFFDFDHQRLVTAAQRSLYRMQRIEEVLKICAGCPVIEQCLDFVTSWPAAQRDVGMVAGGRFWPHPKEISKGKERCQEQETLFDDATGVTTPTEPSVPSQRNIGSRSSAPSTVVASRELNPAVLI